jgi:hypothetical protein
MADQARPGRPSPLESWIGRGRWAPMRRSTTGRRAGGLGELQREQGDAAGPLHQHRIRRADAALGDDALQAVTPAHGRLAASSSVRCSGTRTTVSAGTRISLASTPSTSPPSAHCNFSGAGGPPSQLWRDRAHPVADAYPCDPLPERYYLPYPTRYRDHRRRCSSPEPLAQFPHLHFVLLPLPSARTSQC